MARDEGDATTVDLTDDEGVARRAERGVDLDGVVGLEEVVQTGPADDADVGPRAFGYDIDFTSVFAS